MTSIPYGLRDVKLTPYTDAAGTTLGTTSVDLPYSRTVSFTESEDFNDLRGDDKLVTSHGSGPTAAIDFEAGGLSLEALVVLNGGTLTTTGTGAAVKKVYSKKTSDAKPYFQLEGQAMSDSGGDLHCLIFRCKMTGDLKGEFGDQEFFLTSGTATGYGSLLTGSLDQVYNFVENATAVANTCSQVQFTTDKEHWDAHCRTE